VVAPGRSAFDRRKQGAMQIEPHLATCGAGLLRWVLPPGNSAKTSHIVNRIDLARNRTKTIRNA
jgi:hypothetical protein